MGKYDFFKQQAAEFAAREKRTQQLEQMAALLKERSDLKKIAPEVASILEELTPVKTAS